MTDRDLKARIARSAGGKAGYKQLVRELGLAGGRERRLLLEQLARMTARAELVKLDREQWGIPRPVAAAGSRENISAGTRDNLAAGRLDLHRDGYGFVRPNARQAAGDDDIFIPPNEINGAMQGDQVLVEFEPPKSDGRRQGRIVRILERRNATIVGTFRYARSGRETTGAPGDRGGGNRSSSLGWKGNIVIPFDERMTQPILIPPGMEIPQEPESATPHRVLGREAESASKRESLENLEGLVVDVEITSWPTPTRPPIGRVVEVLGDPDDFGVDVEMMIRKHQLPRIFPDKVLAEARAVAHFDQEEAARREDFRDLPIVTIDGETAKDFDDAVYVRELDGGGYELQVHIADVAEYVRAATDLDLEARLRGTSVYFPDRAIPMLPQELSTDICSLRPNQDRLVLSCIMQLDPAGHIESYEIVEGVIRSAARMTYSEVSQIISPGDDLDEEEEARKRSAATRARYPDMVPRFELMHRLAMLMNKRREERGSIDFDLPEPVIEFDEQGQMRGVTKSERTWANRLIEEFMLAANECVATWLEDLGVPSLYRIHEKPEPRRVVQFEELAAGFGYSLGLGALPVKRIQTRGDRRDSQRSGRPARVYEVPEDIPVTPRMYQKLAARIEGKPEERILSYLMLRSLRQARYSEINEGHFALAAPTYTHFTSPIRRYPDLIVHRITKALLREGVSGEGVIAAGRLSSPWTHPNEGLAGGGLYQPQGRVAHVSHLRHGKSPNQPQMRVPPVPGTWGPGKDHKSHSPDPNSAQMRVPQVPRTWGPGKSQLFDPTQSGTPNQPQMRVPPVPRTGGPGRSQTITPPIPEAELAQIAEETSQTERRAAEAERELVEWKKVRFMQDRVGEEFSALVLNPAKFGLFVELTDLFVEGLVPIDTLRGDRYTWRENTHEIVGDGWGRHFRAGDRVHVILDRILAQERKLQFSIVEEGIPLTGKKPPKPAPKGKKNKRADAQANQKRKPGKRFGNKGKRR